MKNNYYVYVYIDPRNFEDFYYGKGIGSRKYAHLSDKNDDSEKVKRIKAIQKENLEPIIRIIAKDLTEHEAFLVEKTLLWKLGKNLTNKATGNFKNKFRPENTIYKELPDFDFQNSIYFINVGAHNTNRKWNRSWEDNIKYGFVSAGQGTQYSNQLRKIKTGDVICAYLSGYGYVGVGEVLKEAIPVRDFRYNNKSLKECPLESKYIFDNENDLDKCEYPLGIKWVKTFTKEKAKWKKGLFSHLSIKASLNNQIETLDFITKEFDYKFK